MKKTLLSFLFVFVAMVSSALPINPYFPVALNNSWTYSNGKTVEVSLCTEVNGVLYARISNVVGTGYITLTIDPSQVSFSSYSNPDYIMVSGYFAAKPLLKAPVVLNDTWNYNLTSNGYPIEMTTTVTSIATDVTIDNFTYIGCAELTVNIQYPNGYDWNNWLVTRRLYMYPGIGCVKRVDHWSDNTTTEITLVSHQITANEDNLASQATLSSYNYPNPFTQLTNICFDLPKSGSACVSIYNMKGQLVRSFDWVHFEVGNNSVTWDGKDDQGKTVADGMYLYKIQTKDSSTHGKMLFMR